MGEEEEIKKLKEEIEIWKEMSASLITMYNVNTILMEPRYNIKTLPEVLDRIKKLLEQKELSESQIAILARELTYCNNYYEEVQESMEKITQDVDQIMQVLRELWIELKEKEKKQKKAQEKAKAKKKKEVEEEAEATA